MKEKEPRKHPSENAFIRNPIASNQDATGFVPSIPQDNCEANAYRDIVNVPVTAKEPEAEDKMRRKKQK